MEKDFADWLQEEMDRRGWSQSDLANVAGINRQVVNTYVNRRRKKPDPEVLRAIARAFNYPPEFVFQKAFLDIPTPTLDQATLDELKNVLSQLPPEKYAEFIEHGWVMVRNARKVDK